MSKGIFASTASISLPARSVVTLISGGTSLRVESDGSAAAFPDTKSVGIYPNPATHQVEISVADASTVQLINLQGQVVLSGISQGENLKFNVDGLQRGMYLVKIQTGETIDTKKLILN